MEIHGTVYYETQRPPEVPAFVKNHGLLPQQELQQLLRKAKVGGTLLKLSWARKMAQMFAYTKSGSERNALLKFLCFRRVLTYTSVDLDMSSLVNRLVISFSFSWEAFHWIRLPLRRSRPFGGHSQWLHLLTAQVWSPPQLPQSWVLQREAHIQEGRCSFYLDQHFQ